MMVGVRGMLIGAHAYSHPPMVMAADLAADFKNAEAVPDDTRRRMVPADESEMKRANATAVQWLTDVLKASNGEKVGVIVIWTSALPTVSAGEMTFVLVKGAEISPGEWRIGHVVYGYPNLNP